MEDILKTCSECASIDIKSWCELIDYDDREMTFFGDCRKCGEGFGYKIKFSEPYQVACLGKEGNYHEYYKIKPDPPVYKPKIERMIEEAYKLSVDCDGLIMNYKRHYRTDDQNFEEVYNDLCGLIGDLGKVEDKLKSIREKHGDGY